MSKVEKIIAQTSVVLRVERNSKSVNIIPKNHNKIENRNSHEAIPAIIDSTKEIGLSIQISVNRRNRSHVRIKPASAMTKITYTIMPRNDDDSV